jgi:hypothetical protein
MSDPALFKWCHFQADIILCAVRWYLRYALSYLDMEEFLWVRDEWVDWSAPFLWPSSWVSDWRSWSAEMDRNLGRRPSPTVSGRSDLPTAPQWS